MKKTVVTAILFCLFTAGIVAQSRQIRGTITGSGDHEALPGAVIYVVNARSIGATADLSGNYVLEIGAAKSIQLRVSYLGYETQTFTVSEGQNVYNISLKPEQNVLDEIVVTAAGITRARREQGYSGTKVTSGELTAGQSPTVAGGLTAKIPGLQVNAISSGVNPNYHLVLRGNRSITGENQALVVLDGAVVENAILGNINPQDIQDIQVLNGAAGATLYGSEASNGVLIITTKRGVKGKPKITLSHTLTLEQVNFFPKLQSSFGQGSTSDSQLFDPVENQQYGPAFDGTLRDLGYPLENGDQQQVLYTALDERNKFWETGVQNQTDLSLSFGTDNSTSYISAQYFDVTGITPGDKYNRISVRFNNSQKILPNLNAIYTAGLVENNYDTSTATDLIYENLVNLPANIPLLRYKDWQNDKWSTPDGWFNPWYENPYWAAATYRQNTKNTYLTGKAELKWDIKPWLSALYRASLSNRYYQTKQWTPKFTYSDYSLSEQGKTNLTGSIYDSGQNWYRLNQDFQVAARHDLSDFSLNLTLGASNVNKSRKTVNLGATGLVIPDLNNIGNRSGDVNTNTSSNVYHERNYGFWGDLLVGYKNYAYVHVTGRNDWTSVLAPENRSYFYPSVDVSFVPTDAFEGLKDTFLDYWKLRGALSKTGNVNISPYATEAVYNSTTGYSKGTFFTESASLVAKDLKPEITTGWEVGTEFRILKNWAEVQLTYYSTSTVGQAISSSIAPSSGYTGLLLNSGEVTNKGIETSLRLNPIRTHDWNVSLGGNYTHNENLLVDLIVDRIGIPTGGTPSGVVFAQVGQPVNIIVVTDYARVPEKDANGNPYPKELVGRVIVDQNTGYPSRASEAAIQGNTIPKHRLGLDFSVKYKDFTLSSLFEYRGGYKYASISLGSTMDFTGSSARTAYYNRERFVFPNSVVNTGTADNPVYEVNNSVTISDGGTGFWTNSTYNRGTYSNYVYSGDYWKWRELAFSYDVPQSFLHQLTSGVVQEAKISLQGRNLFLWVPKANEYTDPDYSANNSNAIGVSTLTSAPPTRYFGGSVSITF
ncbi:MAG: SusC/RagA family TonB-linked outer membrane protein [Dysgonamonadaceae bacterium]|jgi:TonB-linked SusC/RagA family outer membrane protein|nr:SusC/RagA family TonB-linked outer membrane protein [Dysgonamonadaceae bacterium]